jgi:hypothetical protein
MVSPGIDDGGARSEAVGDVDIGTAGFAPVVEDTGFETDTGLEGNCTEGGFAVDVTGTPRSTLVDLERDAETEDT